MATTEERMIEIAAQWIENQGYQEISLRKLAGQLGMTTGAFYKHFESKDALYSKVSQVLSAKLIKKISPDPSMSPLDQLTTLVQNFTREYDENPCVMEFLFIQLSMSDIYDEENHQFLFLDQMKKLLHELNKTEHSDDMLLSQMLSFVQGYAILIRNKTVLFDQNLVRTTIHRFTRSE